MFKKARSGRFGSMRRSVPLRAALVGALSVSGMLAASGGAAGAAASSPGVTAKTITIGLVNDTTGLAASSFADGVGAAEARVAMQNAEGGVDGRKLVLDVVDTQSSPATAQTAAQDLVETKGVFGIMSDSALFYGAASYLTKAGVPVTGDTFDGPEWGDSSNMFSYGPPTYTSYNGVSYSYNDVSKLLKSTGVKSVAVLAYNISPSATLSANQLIETDTKLGLKNCYANLSVPYGSVDFTADVLQMKQAGCQAVVGTFESASNIGLATGIKNAGLNIKQFYYTSYAQASLSTPAAVAALQGTYSEGLIAAGHTDAAAAVTKFYGELKKWDKSYTGGIPDLGISNSWDATDAMIEGLKLAGPNPTRAKFIAKLRTVKDYTIGGLTPTPVSFNYLTGHLPTTECANFVELKGTTFVPVPANGSPTCGSLVAYKG